ncbi:hypothetical protein AOA12_20575 [Microbacterium sp. No. 7]|nr:hypothetical protein AOA12_20575 [Microbacterium sp. No. 7]
MRFSRGLLLAGATIALVVTPAVAATASEAPTVRDAAVGAAGACEVTSAELAWGFKESFRSYVSGSIAHGGWETVDGAGYETPQFRFTGGTGETGPDAAAGEVAFPGGIVFTGHDGLLNTTIANPTLRWTDAGAVLLLDISGVSMEDALAGETEATTTPQVPFVEIDLSGAVRAGGGSLEAVDAPAAITEEGFAAFPNYEAGTAFDPVTISIAADCAAPAPAETEAPTETSSPAESPAAAETEAAAGAESSDGSGGSALPIVIAGAAAAVAGAVAAAVATARGRRKKAADAAGSA